MTSSGKNLGCFWGVLALTAAATLAWPEVSSNPYQPITARNAFNLKDPPPPATNAPPAVQTPPLAKVILTGITSIFGPSSKRALLEITEQEPGKQPNVKKPILREGEREGSVEVISINLEKSTVLIRNGTVETNLTFEVQKSPASPAPTAPGGPGARPAMAAANPAPLPVPSPTSASTPNIIPRTGGQAVDRTGIGLYGSSATPASTGLATPAVYGNAAYGNLASANSSLRATDTGLNTTRAIRTDTTGQQQNSGAAIDPVSQHLKMSVDAEIARRNNILFPPVPPFPGMENETSANIPTPPMPGK